MVWLNDYELLYLIRSENDHVALKFMFQKYKKFIWKQVHYINRRPIEQDDLFQEGQMMLLKAIDTFDESRSKTFMRYFELIMRRHLQKVNQKIPALILHENLNFCDNYYVLPVNEETEVVLISDLQREIFEDYFVNRMRINDIVKKRGYSRKKVYNTIYRIRETNKIVL